MNRVRGTGIIASIDSIQSINHQHAFVFAALSTLPATFRLLFLPAPIYALAPFLRPSPSLCVSDSDPEKDGSDRLAPFSHQLFPVDYVCDELTRSLATITTFYAPGGQLPSRASTETMLRARGEWSATRTPFSSDLHRHPDSLR